MKARIFITLGILLSICGYTRAHDFVVTLDNQKVYFNITSNKNKTVEVTYNGSIAAKQPTYYEGELTIPAKVKHNNTIYTVTGISAKAFSGADKLTAIIIPSGLTSIGDFAFEGCTALSKIIFPGNNVKFGQGVFFRCDKIQDISLGSDWKNIDLKMFRWSDSLTVITIPAKIEKIQNVKSLRKLEKINVDINNSKFYANDGILYNKNCNILYSCPRAYTGKLKVAQTTNRITPGALIDCTGITGIDLPEQLTTFSFRELSQMPNLEQIILRSATPPHTAKKGNDNLFLLQVQNKNIKIIVKKEVKNSYKERLVQYDGEFCEPDGNTPFQVSKEQMPASKNIIGVKNFNKYE